MALITIVGGPSSDSYVTLDEANDYLADRPDSKNWNDIDYLERERVLRQATLDLDILRFRGTRFFLSDESTIYAPQQLEFPRSWHEYYTGTPEGGTTTTLVDTTFNIIRKEDDYFKYGSIVITEGTNEGEYREISGYAHSTSTFTVSTAFTSAIDTTSSYYLLAPIDRYVKYAQCEQALFLTNNVDITSKYSEWSHAGINRIRIGDVSVSFGEPVGQFGDRVKGVISVNAYRYIRRFLDSNLKMGRA